MKRHILASVALGLTFFGGAGPARAEEIVSAGPSSGAATSATPASPSRVPAALEADATPIGIRVPVPVPVPVREGVEGPPERAPWGRFQLAAGGRVSGVSSSGLDPYAKSDAFGSFFIGGAVSLFESTRWGFAPGVYFETATTTSTARGTNTELQMHRFLVSLEARVRIIPKLYLFGRLAPAVTFLQGSLTDVAVSPRPLDGSHAAFGGELSAGAAIALVQLNPSAQLQGPQTIPLKVWALGEAGYGLHSATQLHLAQHLDAADRRIASGIDFDPISLSGPLARAGVALTY